MIQKYNIEKHSQIMASFELQHKGISIRQMEWLESSNGFNKENSSHDFDDDFSNTFDGHHSCDGADNEKAPYQNFLGLDKRSWNVIHHFNGLVEQEEDQEDPTIRSPRAKPEFQPSHHSAVPEHRQETAVQHIDDASESKIDVNGEKTILDKTKKPEAIGLVIAVFVDREAQQFKDDGSISVSIPEHANSLEVTVSYKLQLLCSKGNGWKSSLISASEICGPPLYQIPNHDPLFFSRNPQVDFTIRRNLEHILSVCSINTATKFIWNTKSRLFQESPSKEPAFALTCGEFAGHHIVSSASFFAFQFLLEIYKFLKNLPSNKTTIKLPHPTSTNEKQNTPKTTEYLEPLATSKLPRKGLTKPGVDQELSEVSRTYCEEQRDRILNVRKGHLNWMFYAAWKEDRWDFGGSQWATGQPIIFPSYGSSARKSSPSLANTPFQIIKAFEFAKSWSDDKATEHSSERIGEEQIQESNRQIPDNPAFNEKSTIPDHASDAKSIDRADEVPAFEALSGIQKDDQDETPKYRTTEGLAFGSKPLKRDGNASIEQVGCLYRE